MSALCAVAEAHLGVQEQHQARFFESEGLEIDVADVPGLVNIQKAIENCPVEIVDLPIQNGGSFHSYVSLPEGSFKRIQLMFCSKCLMNLTYQRLWSESLVKRTSW